MNAQFQCIGCLVENFQPSYSFYLEANKKTNVKRIGSKFILDHSSAAAKLRRKKGYLINKGFRCYIEDGTAFVDAKVT